MLVKLDHVTFNTPGFDPVCRRLTRLGYQDRFILKHIINISNKHPLMKTRHQEHHIALFEKDGYPSIEVISYPGMELQGPEYLKPLAVSGQQPGEVSEYVIAPIGYRGLSIPSACPDKSRKFWSDLGFKVDALNTLSLSFSTPLQRNPLNLWLRHTPGQAKHYLDTQGYACLAFVTNNIVREQRKLEKCGWETSQINQLRLNSHTLDIFFVTGPSGELVEIIERKT